MAINEIYHGVFFNFDKDVFDFKLIVGDRINTCSIDRYMREKEKTRYLIKSGVRECTKKTRQTLKTNLNKLTHKRFVVGYCVSEVFFVDKTPQDELEEIALFFEELRENLPLWHKRASDMGLSGRKFYICFPEIEILLGEGDNEQQLEK